MLINRCYVINGEIEGDCPGVMSHTAKLAQRNPAAQHECRIRGLSDWKLLQRRVRIFWCLNFQKFE